MKKKKRKKERKKTKVKDGCFSGRETFTKPAIDSIEANMFVFNIIINVKKEMNIFVVKVAYKWPINLDLVFCFSVEFPLINRSYSNLLQSSAHKSYIYLPAGVSKPKGNFRFRGLV